MKFTQRNRSAVVTVIVTICLLMTLFEHQALAYADPGTGALLWQLIGASVFGALFYIGRAVRWVKERLGKGDGVKQPESSR